jgi:hypothetical protein
MKTRWTLQDYEAYENRRKASRPKSERSVRDEPLEASQRKAKDPARTVVRITSFRCRLLDPDNLIGGAKYFLDGLRYAGLIPDDTSQTIVLEVSQVKVNHMDEEKTVIEL